MKKNLVIVNHLFLPAHIYSYKFFFFKKKFSIYYVDLAFINYPHYKNYSNYFNKKFGSKYYCIQKLSDWNSLKKKFNSRNTIFWRIFSPFNFVTFKISLDISKFKSFKTYDDGYVFDIKKKNLITLKNFFKPVYIKLIINFFRVFVWNKKIFLFKILEKFFLKKKNIYKKIILLKKKKKFF